MNLAVCPEELKALDPNAEANWKTFVKKVGVVFSRGEHIEDRTALLVRNFGIPSLLRRMIPGMSERERARVWWRESLACNPRGNTIPDLSEANLQPLNPFLSEGEKYGTQEADMDDPDKYGTRARGTDSLVYRILQSPSYRTEPIVMRLLEAAMVAPKPSEDELRRRAQNILARIELHGKAAIPRDAFMLVAMSAWETKHNWVKSGKRRRRTSKTLEHRIKLSKSVRDKQSALNTPPVAA